LGEAAAGAGRRVGAGRLADLGKAWKTRIRHERLIKNPFVFNGRSSASKLFPNFFQTFPWGRLNQINGLCRNDLEKRVLSLRFRNCHTTPSHRSRSDFG
jgi:hypothetical protein